MSGRFSKKKYVEDILHNFYLQNDPEALKNGFDISELAQFTIDKGSESLNRLLFKKYGKKIIVGPEKLKEREIIIYSEVFAKRKSENYNFDKEKLKAELEFLFVQMKDTKQSVYLDDLIDWVCKYGLERLDRKLEVQYGISLTNYNLSCESSFYSFGDNEEEKEESLYIIRKEKRNSFNIMRKNKKLQLPCCLNIILVGKLNKFFIFFRK